LLVLFSTTNGTDFRLGADVDEAGVLEAGDEADDETGAVEVGAALVVVGAIEELCATAEVCNAA
jgi:hypothetical protein